MTSPLEAELTRLNAEVRELRRENDRLLVAANAARIYLEWPGGLALDRLQEALAELDKP